MADKAYVYKLTKDRKTVYYGITNDPDRRAVEHANSDKDFDSLQVLRGPMSRAKAQEEEARLIRWFRSRHNGRAPKHN